MSEPYDVLKAAEYARTAIRRGDLNAAERWFRIADRAMAIAERLDAMVAAHQPKQWRPPRNPN